MTDPTLLFAITLATFFFAGFIKGVVGLGLPVVAMGLLGVVMPPALAASLLVVPATITNIWQLAAGPAIRPLLKRLWPLLVAICVGIWLGGGQLTGPDTGRATAGLGVLLMVYALLGLFSVHVNVPRAHERLIGAPIGVITGFIAGATGIFTVPMVPYLNGMGFDKEEMVQALGLSFTVCSLALGASLVHDGALAGAVWGQSTLALVPTALGMVIGTKVRGKINGVLFRRCFLAGLFVLGADLAIRHVI